MNSNNLDYLIYWTLLLGLIPLVVGLVAIALGKFLTINHKKVTFTQASRFSLCMLLITVFYFAISFLLNSIINKQYSDKLGASGEDIRYGVYVNDELPKTKKLVSQFVSVLRKTSNPGSSIHDSASPYLIQHFGSEDGNYTLGGISIRQFDPTKYDLKDSDCGPIDPEFSDKVDKGECKLVGKNPEGKNIYAMYAKIHRWKDDIGPDRYVPTDLITTYGNTRISLEIHGTGPTLDERIKIMQSFHKIESKKLKFFNPNFYEQKFWMPSLY